MTKTDIPSPRPKRKKAEHPRDVKARILDRHDHKCVYCGCCLRYKTEPCKYTGWDVIVGTYPTIDHAIPVARGGSSDETNLVPACRQCNSQKGSKTPEEYKSWKEVRA